MRRREVIALVGAAAAWTAAARAQTAQKIPRIGILDLAPTNSEPGLRRGLRELGYVEGQNVIIEARYADGRQERLPELAAELLRLKMDGALAGYGPDFRAVGRRPASYVARILAGSLPRDLPVEAFDQPALAINLKTAKAIGLDIPPLLLTRADEVIE